jgi:hypothetical protein
MVDLESTSTVLFAVVPRDPKRESTDQEARFLVIQSNGRGLTFFSLFERRKVIWNI